MRSFTKVRWYYSHSYFRYSYIFLAWPSIEGKTRLKNYSYILIQSISLKSSGSSSSGRSTKVFSVMYSVYLSIYHLIFLVRLLLINSYSIFFKISCLYMLRKFWIDVSDANIFFLVILPSTYFGSFLFLSFLSYVSLGGS